MIGDQAAIRERRAYQLVVAGGVAGAVGVVGIVLAITGIVGAGLPIIALIVAALCALGFARTAGARLLGAVRHQPDQSRLAASMPSDP